MKIESAETNAVPHHVLRIAKSSAGSGANHISGHQGFRSLPNQNKTALHTTVKIAAIGGR